MNEERFVSVIMLVQEVHCFQPLRGSAAHSGASRTALGALVLIFPTARWKRLFVGEKGGQLRKNFADDECGSFCGDGCFTCPPVEAPQLIGKHNAADFKLGRK